MASCGGPVVVLASVFYVVLVGRGWFVFPRLSGRSWTFGTAVVNMTVEMGHPLPNVIGAGEVLMMWTLVLPSSSVCRPGGIVVFFLRTPDGSDSSVPLFIRFPFFLMVTFAGICCALNGGTVAGVAAYMTALPSCLMRECGPWSVCLFGCSMSLG